MSQEYKILQVSEQEPREWNGPHGIVYYIKVKLEGHDKPVSIGKKKPDALKSGYTVYGTIEESDLPEDKFKSEQNPNPSGPVHTDNVNKPDEAYWADKQAQIRAQWAINQSREYIQHMLGDEAKLTEVFETAKLFYSMVDRVKDGEPEAQINPDDADVVTGGPMDNFDEPINLDDIPF